MAILFRLIKIRFETNFKRKARAKPAESEDEAAARTNRSGFRGPAACDTCLRSSTLPPPLVVTIRVVVPAVAASVHFEEEDSVLAGQRQGESSFFLDWDFPQIEFGFHGITRKTTGRCSGTCLPPKPREVNRRVVVGSRAGAGQGRPAAALGA